MRRGFFGGPGGFGGGGGPAGAIARGPGAFGGPGGLFGAIGGAGIVHASYTLKDAQGTYETIDTQVGTAEDVSSSSLTVKSADGFSQTYDVTTSTIVDAQYEGILSVKVGDMVSVQALANGSTITAQRIQDVTQLQASRPAWAPATVERPSTGARGSHDHDHHHSHHQHDDHEHDQYDQYHGPPGRRLALAAGRQPPASSRPPRPLSGRGG